MTEDSVAVPIQRSSQRAKPRRRLTRVRAIQLVLVVAILLVWELVGRRVGSFILPPPSTVASEAVQMLRSGELFKALRDSLTGLLLGYAIAIVVGVSLGGLMGWYRRLGVILMPFVSALYVVPIAALVPLFIVWLGIGLLPRVVTVALFAVFEILITSYTGVREVDGRLVEMARTFGAKQRQVFSKVVLFAALPVVFAGVRIGAGRALKGMVIAELLFAVTGLGGLVLRYSAYYQTARMMVVVVTVALMGVLLVGLMQQFERRLAPWYHRSR
jgi:ABC-type nitrate/sulfonate/bicarbonate transport system permease component